MLATKLSRSLMKSQHLHAKATSISIGRSVIGTNIVSQRWFSDAYYPEDNSLSFTDNQFVDNVLIEVKGGKGGDGCVSFMGLSPGKKRPSGGPGGRGGNVYIVADNTIGSLKMPSVHYFAGDGRNGSSDGLKGRSGRDVFVRVPIGTTVEEEDHPYSRQSSEFDVDAYINNGNGEDSGTGYEEENLCDSQQDKKENSSNNKRRKTLDQPKQILLVAQGGIAGKGNGNINSQSAQQISADQHSLPGQAGQVRRLRLTLKLIADCGLLGAPNAGKSSLLRALSSARPRVAPYPFTTLAPSLGVVAYSDLQTVTVADLPGLIAGAAAEDRGLGHAFLNHATKAKALIIVVDLFNDDEEGKGPVEALKMILSELQQFEKGHLLQSRPLLLFGNKTDLFSDQTQRLLIEEQVKLFAKRKGLQFLSGSAVSGEGMKELAKAIRLMCQDQQLQKQQENNKQQVEQ